MISKKEKLELKLKEALQQRQFLTSQKDEIKFLNFYTDEFMNILESIIRSKINIMFIDFLNELDTIKTHKKAKNFSNKFINKLLKI